MTPIRVQAIPGHPVCCSDRHGRRPSPMWEAPVPLFPDWFTEAALDRHFTVVDQGADVIITTTGYHMSTAEMERIDSLRSLDRPLVVIYTLDDLAEPRQGGWDRSDAWARAIRQFSLGADLLAGPQLPAELVGARYLPLPYGPLVAPGPRPTPDDMRGRPVDVYFSGAWLPPSSGGQIDPRNRTFRGRLVEELWTHCSDLRVHTDKVHFWRTNPRSPGEPVTVPVAKDRLLADHVRALDLTRLALAPPGHAYYTARHSDVLARGAALLTFDVVGRVRVPAPELWSGTRIGFEFGADDGDLAATVREALGDVDRLSAVAAQGWEYAREYLDPDRQVQRLAAVLRDLG